MKPENWKSYSEQQKIKVADELLKSDRGPYLIGQALAIGATALEARNDESNREDMEILGEVIFQDGYDVEKQRLERAKLG